MHSIERTFFVTVVSFLMGLSFQIVDANAQLGTHVIDVPSDPNATYTIIQKNKTNGIAFIQTNRKGSSGISYSSRLINCRQDTFKYLATEDDANLFMEKHNNALETLDESNMGKLTNGSISYYVAVEACK